MEVKRAQYDLRNDQKFFIVVVAVVHLSDALKMKTRPIQILRLIPEKLLINFQKWQIAWRMSTDSWACLHCLISQKVDDIIVSLDFNLIDCICVRLTFIWKIHLFKITFPHTHTHCAALRTGSRTMIFWQLRAKHASNLNRETKVKWNYSFFVLSLMVLLLIKPRGNRLMPQSTFDAVCHCFALSHSILPVVAATAVVVDSFYISS